MKKFLCCTLILTFLCVGSAVADPIVTNLGNLQNVFDDITVDPVGGSSIDVTTDYLSRDGIWSIDGSGGSVATMIIELAGYADINKFGIYQGNQYVQLFSGGQGAGDQALVSIKSDGSVHVNFSDTGIDFALNSEGDDYFGYYLDSSAGAAGGLFHSDTDDNADGFDHFLAYQGNGEDVIELPGLTRGVFGLEEYILAFEDLDGSVADWDFVDFVVLVESVTPISEPASMLLLGMGLLGLGVFNRKKSMK